MKKRGPLGFPRFASKIPLVSKPVDDNRVYPDSLESGMSEVADDVEVSMIGGNGSASVDFRIRSEPKREMKSSVIVFQKLGPNDATLRLPLIHPGLMSDSEVKDDLKKAMTRANTPDSARIENPTRRGIAKEHRKAHNPHVIWTNDSDTTYDESTSWIGRFTRAFNKMSPEEVRLTEG